MILEVTSTHFTMGKKIPSLFLRVSSDRSVECDLRNAFGGDTGIVKTKVLMPKEFEEVKALADRPELGKVGRRYELTHFVFDSWTEWDIKVQHPNVEQEIIVANFEPIEPRYTEEFAQPYPDVLVRLGCSISKLRDEVCGDELAWRRTECETALKNK